MGQPGSGDLTGIRALRSELGAMFSIDSSLGRLGPGPKFVALVGPPGSGKTLDIGEACGRLRAEEPKTGPD